MQPPILMNRFIINLRSLNAPSSSQDSSTRQHWSRFSAPNFHIPGSFLGNIGEDLQDGHEAADDDRDGDQAEIDPASVNIRGSPQAGPGETPGSSSSRPRGEQVSVRIHSGSKWHKRTLFRSDWSHGQPLELWKMS